MSSSISLLSILLLLTSTLLVSCSTRSSETITTAPVPDSTQNISVAPVPQVDIVPTPEAMTIEQIIDEIVSNIPLDTAASFPNFPEMLLDGITARHTGKGNFTSDAIVITHSGGVNHTIPGPYTPPAGLQNCINESVRTGSDQDSAELQCRFGTKSFFGFRSFSPSATYLVYSTIGYEASSMRVVESRSGRIIAEVAGNPTFLNWLGSDRLVYGMSNPIAEGDGVFVLDTMTGKITTLSQAKELSLGGVVIDQKLYAALLRYDDAIGTREVVITTYDLATLSEWESVVTDDIRLRELAGIPL